MLSSIITPLILIPALLLALYAVYFVVVFFASCAVILVRREFSWEPQHPDTLGGGIQQTLLTIGSMIVIPMLLLNFTNVSNAEAMIVGFLMWPIIDQGWYFLGALIVTILVCLS